MTKLIVAFHNFVNVPETQQSKLRQVNMGEGTVMFSSCSHSYIIYFSTSLKHVNKILKNRCGMDKSFYLF